MGYNTVGGIAGLNEAGWISSSDKQYAPSVTSCINYGTVTYNSALSGNELGFYIGGIVGYAEAYSKITQCKVEENSDGSNLTVTGRKYVGGIVGYLTINAKVEGSSILDNTAVTGTQYVGGIAGMTESYTYVTSCSTGSSTKVTGENYIGGIVGYSYAQIKSCINGSTIVKLMEDSICGSIAGYVYSTSYIVDCTGADPQWGAAGN